MSKSTGEEKLASAYRIAMERLSERRLLDEAKAAKLSDIVVRLALERPLRFATVETLTEEIIRRFEAWRRNSG